MSFIQENKEFLAKHGMKTYLKVVAKLTGYIIVNPLIILMLMVYQHWLLAILWVPFTIYGLLIAFQGKSLMVLIQQWQTKRMMNKLYKDNRLK